MRLLTGLFLIFIVYGSLFPLTGWTEARAPLFGFLLALPAQVEKADLIQNLLAYMPFGLFLAGWLRRRMRAALALAGAVLGGSLLSLTMEGLQQFLPVRDASSVDLFLNMCGTAIGAMLALLLSPADAADGRVAALRHAWVRPGTLANLGLAALAMWALAQTTPLVPTLDIAQLRGGLAHLYHALMGDEPVALVPALVYAGNLVGLGLLARTLTVAGKPALLPFALFVAVVLALKVVIEGRQLSPEAVSGAAVALAVLALMRRVQRHDVLCLSGIAVLACTFALAELASTPGMPVYPFNWIPFAGQMSSLSGLQNILELFWPFFAMACFARSLTQRQPVWLAAGGGAVLMFGAVLALEWAQQALPGRYGDVTPVGLALLGWLLPWMLTGDNQAPAMFTRQDSDAEAEEVQDCARLL